MGPKRVLPAVVFALLFTGWAAWAGEADERTRQFFALDLEVRKQFKEQNYERAAELCNQMIALIPKHPGPHYNLACSLARLGKTQEALGELEAAAERGFNEADHMLEDADLASLRPDARFAKAVEKARSNERTGGAAYEPGQEIEGIKTVEGNPQAGLRYRLRMSPAARPERPERLIIWLHPSGGSANQMIEGMSRRLAPLGFALLVLTQKEWRFWSPAHVKRLLEGTLPDVAKIPGVSTERPILMGYSAGGQIAVSMWHALPGKFGGLILDAAYPVQPKQGGFDILPLPNDPAVKQTPFFVLVGEQDGGSRLWRQAEPAWRQAGVPLTVRHIPDKGHAWLFGPGEVDEMCAWLEQVAAGKLPGAPAPAETKPPEEPKAK